MLVWLLIWEKVIAGAGSHWSVATGVGGAGMAAQSTVRLPGTLLKTGACVSCTAMLCDTCVELPQLSVAVQVRVTVYCWSEQLPLAVWVLVCVKLMLGVASQLSVTKGLITTGRGWLHCRVRLAGVLLSTGAS